MRTRFGLMVVALLVVFVAVPVAAQSVTSKVDMKDPARVIAPMLLST